MVSILKDALVILNDFSITVRDTKHSGNYGLYFYKRLTHEEDIKKYEAILIRLGLAYTKDRDKRQRFRIRFQNLAFALWLSRYAVSERLEARKRAKFLFLLRNRQLVAKRYSYKREWRGWE